MAYTIKVAEYTLILSGMTGSGTLIGATSAFVSDEDDTNDIFTPSRLQTADIKIIDEGGHEWRNCIPEGDAQFSVTLYSNYNDPNNRKVVWRGYLKSQAYSAEMFDSPQTVTLVAHCPLTALQSFDIDPDAYEIATFGQLIEHCVTSPGLSNSPFNCFYFPDTNIIERLQCCFPWSLLYDIEEDYTKKARYNCLEALEEFARFFGFTMRYLHNGQDQGIQFLCSDRVVNYHYISITELQNYNKTHATSAIDPATITYSYINLDMANYFNGLDNSLEIIRGVNKTTVTADMANEPFKWSHENDMKRKFLGLTMSFSGYLEDKSIHILEQTYLDTLLPSEIMCQNCVVSFPGMTFDSTKSGLQQQVLPVKGMRPIYIDLYQGDLNKKKSIDWKFAWQVKAASKAALSSVSTAAKMRTIKPYIFKEGYINIRATLYYIRILREFFDWGVGNGVKLYAYIKIGDYYWNASSSKWLKNAATFPMEINSLGDDTGKSDIKSNINVILDGFIGYSNGFVIRVDSTTWNGTTDWANGVSGIVEFGIVGCTGIDGEGSVSAFIEDLNVTFLPFYTENEEEQKDSAVYVEKNASAYTDEKEVKLIFASNKGNHYGSSILTTNGQKPIQLIKQFGSTSVPEQTLVRRISSFYTKGREILTLHLNIYNSKIFPLGMVVYNGKNYNCISVSRDYEKDDATITVIEV